MATVDVLASVVVGPADRVVVLRGDKEVFVVDTAIFPPTPNGMRVDVVAPLPEPDASPARRPWLEPRGELPVPEPPSDGPPPESPPPPPADPGVTTSVERVSRLKGSGKD